MWQRPQRFGRIPFVNRRQWIAGNSEAMKRTPIGLTALLAATTAAVFARAAEAPKSLTDEQELPDRYPYVVQDVLKYCQPKKGFWIDLGAGKGQVAIPLIEKTDNPVVMLDPDVAATSQGLEIARKKGLEHRLVAVSGVAEDMPFPDNSVDLLVSRGSIFFWDDPVKGLREVYRVLRPGARAYIGGGAGSGYPKWAAEKLIESRKEQMKGEQAEKWKRFVALRRPEQMREWAEDAGLPEFEVMGRGAISAEDPRVGQGVWLLFEKKPEVVTKKGEDRVQVEIKGDTAVYWISCPSGIGEATITPWTGWAKQVVVRLRLGGLESFEVSNGKDRLRASLQSHGDHARLLQVCDEGGEKKVEQGSPFWTEIRVLDANGTPIHESPERDGYFEVPIPKALVEDNPKSLTLGWIDFYRD
jgi:SAM-dependent methyltransferase